MIGSTIHAIRKQHKNIKIIMTNIQDFFNERLNCLEEISKALTRENCFDKLVEYFQVCQEISRKESQIISDEGDTGRKASFLCDLPYCMTNSIYSHYFRVFERYDEEDFFGCKMKNQTYGQIFVDLADDESSWIEIVFTYDVNPSKETITLAYAGIHKTLSYLEKEEKDKSFVEKMKDLVFSFFHEQREERVDFFLNPYYLCGMFGSSNGMVN